MLMNRLGDTTLPKQMRYRTALCPDNEGPSVWVLFAIRKMQVPTENQFRGAACGSGPRNQSAVGSRFMVNSIRPSPRSRQLSTSVM